MNLHELKPRLLAVAVLAVISSSAFASVDAAGTPDLSVPVLRTYGVDVPTRAGLKTIVPQGWTLLIHKSATLPATMSWKPNDPWTSVLNDLAAKNNLAVRMDWAAKTVTVMSPEVAAQQKEKEAEIIQAAKTPLPSLAPEAAKPVTTASAPVTAAVSQAGGPPIIKAATQATVPTVASATQGTQKAPLVDQLATLKQMASAPSATVQPSPLPIQPQATQQPQPLLINPPVAQVSTTAAALAAQSVQPRNVAASQVGGSMKDLLSQVAARYGYVLSWEAPDVEIPGAVTLLGVDIGEDAKLLQKAIGLTSTPVSIQVFRSSSVIRVLPRSRSTEAVAILESPYNGPVVPYVSRSSAPAPAYAVNMRAPALAPTADLLHVATVNVPAEQSIVAPSPRYQPVADTHVAPASVKLTVLKGDSLANSLKTFFLSQGWDLQWKVNSDLQADYPVSIEGADGKEVMKKLLPHLGLIADFYNQSKTVVIRSSDSSTN
jgi:hypothetical protein